MAPEYWHLFKDLQRYDFPKKVLGPLNKFWDTYSDRHRSNSKTGHLLDGWFMIYDHPSSERWLQENQRNQTVFVFTDTSYRVVHFPDLKDAIEFKLRWC